MHYISISYQQLLKDNNILQSMRDEEIVGTMRHKNHVYAILKTEMELSKYITDVDVALAIAEYIVYYNMVRPQRNMHKMTLFEYDDYLSSGNLFKRLQLPMVIQA